MAYGEKSSTLSSRLSLVRLVRVRLFMLLLVFLYIFLPFYCFAAFFVVVVS